MIPELHSAIDQFIVTWLFDALWQSSILVLLILLVRWIGGDALLPRWRHALWGLVALRLLLPVLPPSPTSIFGLMPATPEASVQHIAEPAPALPQPQIQTPRHAAPSAGEQGVSPLARTSPAKQNATATKVPRTAVPWLILWVAVALVLILRLMAAHLRLRWQLIPLPADDLGQQDRLRRLLREAASISQLPEWQWRRLRLRLWKTPSLPALTGIWHPTVIIDRNLARSLPDVSLRMVFAHELAHVRRHDTSWQMLWQVLVALHWFNPCAWLAAHLARQDAELATGELVSTSIGVSERKDYGSALLEVLQQFQAGKNCNPLTIGVVSGPDLLRRRLLMIVKPRRRPMLGAILGAAALVSIAAVGLTAAPADVQGDGERPARSEGDPSAPPQDSSVRLAAEQQIAVGDLVVLRVHANGEKRTWRGRVQQDGQLQAFQVRPGGFRSYIDDNARRLGLTIPASGKSHVEIAAAGVPAVRQRLGLPELAPVAVEVASVAGTYRVVAGPNRDVQTGEFPIPLDGLPLVAAVRTATHEHQQFYLVEKHFGLAANTHDPVTMTQHSTEHLDPNQEIRPGSVLYFNHLPKRRGDEVKAGDSVMFIASSDVKFEASITNLIYPHPARWTNIVRDDGTIDLTRYMGNHPANLLISEGVTTREDEPIGEEAVQRELKLREAVHQAMIPRGHPQAIIPIAGLRIDEVSGAVRTRLAEILRIDVEKLTVEAQLTNEFLVVVTEPDNHGITPGHYRLPKPELTLQAALELAHWNTHQLPRAYVLKADGAWSFPNSFSIHSFASDEASGPLPPIRESDVIWIGSLPWEE